MMPSQPSRAARKEAASARGLLVCLGLLLVALCLVACNEGPLPEPEGPTVADLPIMPDASELEEDNLSLALSQISQAHRGTVQNSTIGYFQVDQPLIDTIDYYHTELDRFGWTLIDVLEFGNGGFVRRYHKQEQRAILAFHPEGDATDFMLLQGAIR
jgi:hypothetical protein